MHLPGRIAIRLHRCLRPRLAHYHSTALLNRNTMLRILANMTTVRLGGMQTPAAFVRSGAAALTATLPAPEVN